MTFSELTTGHAGKTPATRIALQQAFTSCLWAIPNAGHALFLTTWSILWMTAALLACAVTGAPTLALRWARRYWSSGLLWAAGTRVVVKGGDRIDWSKPHVFVTNHQSMIDIPVLFVALPVELRFIAKRELFRVPFLGWYMHAVGMIPIDRKNTPAAIDTLHRAAAKVRAGANVLTFAEGTRSRDGYIRPFKKGPFRLALEAGVPVVPVAIEGARHALPSDGFRVRPFTVHVRLGAPIPTAELSDADWDALCRKVHGEVVAMNRALGGLGAFSQH